MIIHYHNGLVSKELLPNDLSHVDGVHVAVEEIVVAIMKAQFFGVGMIVQEEISRHDHIVSL